MKIVTNLKNKNKSEIIQDAVQGKKVAVHCKTKDEAIALCLLVDNFTPRTYDYVSRINSYWIDGAAYVFPMPLNRGIGRGLVDYWKGKGYEILEASDFI